MTPADEVRRAGDDVLRTLREVALYELPSKPYLPPPHDVEAERSVLEALLCARRRPAALACCADDFYLPAHGAVAAVVEALEETGRLDGQPDARTIIGVLARQGADRTRAAQFLVAIIDDEPVRGDVDELAERVAELGRRRAALVAMQKLDAAWRTGLEPGPAFFRRLRELLQRWEASGA